MLPSLRRRISARYLRQDVEDSRISIVQNESYAYGPGLTVVGASKDGLEMKIATLVGVWAACLLLSDSVEAQVEFEQAPISYDSRPTHDPVTQLQARLDDGEVQLRFDEDHGYLPAVLKALGVPESSQSLVFSKTSFQVRRITSRRPRAIYFNHHAYVGWVQHGDVVEVSAVSPEQGAIFYTLSQEETAAPRFVRDKGQCLLCHASSRTKNVPGHLVRSVYANSGGQPQFGSGTFTTDHTSSFLKRWGGWYVSGTHGAMRHMGNVPANDRLHPENIDREAGANITDLNTVVNVEPYLQPTSDIVALMVLEHQTQMHNLITAASYDARSAAHHDDIMNKALERSANFQSDSTKRRIASFGEKVLKYMLFCDEFRLTSPVTGPSQFTTQFEAQGPHDKLGRSLRNFDLQNRIFRYPCSYLIYSPSFDALPKTIKTYVGRRLGEVLSEKNRDKVFSHLSANDRQNILEILRDTKPGFVPLK